MYFNTFSVQNYVDVSPIQKLIYLRKISPILIWPTGPLASAGAAPAQASARAASSPVSCQRSTAGRGSWRPHGLTSPPSHPQHPQAHLTCSPAHRLAGWSGPSPHPPQRGPVWPHPPPGAAARCSPWLQSARVDTGGWRPGQEPPGQAGAACGRSPLPAGQL